MIELASFQRSVGRRRISPLVACFALLTQLLAVAATAQERRDVPLKPPTPVKVGTFPAEVVSVYTSEDGLPSDDVLSVAISAEGKVYAGTSKGLALKEGDSWKANATVQGPIVLIAAHETGIIATAGEKLVLVAGDTVKPLAPLPASAKDSKSLRSLVGGSTVLLGTTAGLFRLNGTSFEPIPELADLLKENPEIRQVAVSRDNRIAVASPNGLFVRNADGNWQVVHPRQGRKSWAPVDVRAVAFDSRDRLWFASAQGAGSLEGADWKLYSGMEGLPYDDFTTMSAGEDGVVWYGTKIGAIRQSDSGWNYRQGLRWIPDDVIASIAVDNAGNAWFGTSKGLSLIERKPTTLAKKAEIFESEIDKYHRRTPFGYVLGVNLKSPGDTSEWTQHDSDNDGLWTAMYGAGECFAYAATKDPKAKARATKAFEAVAFLSEVTQGGSNPAPRGFPARTILSTSGHNPNKQDNYSAEADFVQKIGDPLWKVIVPRWPTSADRKWYWKTDTSSDELDGHYFLYGLYHDLVAETDAEKARVREVTARVTDHLIEHDYCLVDHDGKPTRWGIFAPKYLNGPFWTAQRGLNSLSILSYIKVAEHVTGDPKYKKAYENLVYDHHYAGNVAYPKVQNGPATGNQSDDEMAFMCYYHLLKYETDPKLRRIFAMSLRGYWALEEPEQCPLFNYIYAALSDNKTRYSWVPQSCLDDSADTLKRIPLDRIRWGFKNSHRIDVKPLKGFAFFARGEQRGHLYNGKVVPIDERFVEHWNHSPWTLDEGGNGNELSDGASYLLPYYMGLYYKFLE